MGNRIRYRFGDAENAFANQTRGGAIGRMAHRGFGVPPGDLELIRNKMLSVEQQCRGTAYCAPAKATEIISIVYMDTSGQPAAILCEY